MPHSWGGLPLRSCFEMATTGWFQCRNLQGLGLKVLKPRATFNSTAMQKPTKQHLSECAALCSHEGHVAPGAVAPVRGHQTAAWKGL